MKILHLNTESGWRGGENQILLLLQELKKHSDIECYAALLAGSEAATRLAPHATIKEIKTRGGFNPFVAAELAGYCRAKGISIIDAHSSKAHTLALLTKMFMPTLKIVVHRRVDNPPRRDLVNRWKYTTKSVNRYIAISSAIKSILEGIGIDPKRIALARSAVPFYETSEGELQACQKSLREKLGITAATPLFGNASAISHQKAYGVLLNACARLRDAKVKFHCAIAGDGPQMQEVQTLCSQLDLNSHVTFLGFLQDVKSFLRGLDFFTIPSANEGLGTIIMDATYCGLPVIGSRVGGIPEMIIHQETGLLMQPGNAAELAGHIKHYIEYPDVARTYQRACSARLQSEFSLDAMVGGNLSVYKSLL